MLKMRPAQMAAFREAASRSFENEMVEHGKKFVPLLSEEIGEDQLRLAVRRTIERSDYYGFTLKGPIRLCVELMFLFGSDFDTDPQYSEMLSSLHVPRKPIASEKSDW